jgi:hypothetical protein
MRDLVLMMTVFFGMLVVCEEMRMREKPVKLSQDLSKLCYDLAKKLSVEDAVLREGDLQGKPSHTGAFRFLMKLSNGYSMFGCNASRVLWELWQSGIKNREDLRVLGHVIEKKVFGKSVGEYIPELEPFFDPYAEPVSRVFGTESAIRN